MTILRKQLESSPAYARLLPYVIIVALTFAQFGGDAVRHWMYLVEMLVGLWCIFEMRDLVPEMRWAVSWEAIAAGILVVVIWVGLDPYYPKLEFLFPPSAPLNPFKHYGADSPMAWFFVAVHIFGSALIVPPIEEACYRSFLYRYFVRIEFTTLPLSHLHWLSLVVTSLLFGLSHYQWLAGFLCGLIYQGLVIRKGRLGDAMTAHAITNFLLGVWIVWKGAWNFW